MRISDWSSDVCSSDLNDAVGADRLLRSRLNGGYFACNIIRRPGRLAGKRFYLLRHHREPQPGITRAGRFTGSVKREQICLSSIVANKAQNGFDRSEGQRVGKEVVSTS